MITELFEPTGLTSTGAILTIQQEVLCQYLILTGGNMTRIAETGKRMGIAAIVSVLLTVLVLSVLNSVAASTRKSRSGVVTSREATDMWHSYEIKPNYNYYFSGPKSQPDFIVGIDNKYRLTSKLWKPVDLTPEMLKKWFNWSRPRVGYSQDPYGAFIVDPNGERVGLWYSVKDWRPGGLLSAKTTRFPSQDLPSREEAAVESGAKVWITTNNRKM
jgi:hypothetical protein